VVQQPLIFAISNSISQSLLTSTINTNNPTVGSGSGIIFNIQVNNISSVSSMVSEFISNRIKGPFSNQLATAIALGIDDSLPLSKGSIIISGSGSTSPSTGIGIGKIT